MRRCAVPMDVVGNAALNVLTDSPVSMVNVKGHNLGLTSQAPLAMVAMRPEAEMVGVCQVTNLNDSGEGSYEAAYSATKRNGSFSRSTGPSTYKVKFEWAVTPPSTAADETLN